MPREHLCGYDLNLTYPQDGHFPDLQFVFPTDPNRAGFIGLAQRKTFTTSLTRLAVSSKHAGTPSVRVAEEHVKLARRAAHIMAGSADIAEVRAHQERDGKQAAKRDLSLRANGTIDPWYGCFLFDEMVDYALNYTWPWSE